MRKILLRLLLGVILLLGVSLFALLQWLQGAGFRDWVQQQVVAQLATYNLCLVSGKLTVKPFSLQAEYQQLQIAVCGEAQPFFRSQRLYLQLSVIDLWQKKFAVRDLMLDQPTLSVQFNNNGTSNLQKIRLPETNTTAANKINLEHLAITNGRLEYQQAVWELAGSLAGLRINFAPKEKSYQVQLLSNGGAISYQKQQWQLIELFINGEFNSVNGELTALRLHTSAGDLTLAGKISNWAALEYALTVETNLQLAPIDQLFSQLPLRGGVALRGQLQGNLQAYQFSGQLTAAQLVAAGIQLQGLSLQNITLAAPLWQPMAANFRGRLALADAFYQQLRLQGLQSKVTINQQYLTLTDLRVQLLGGTAQGQVKLSRQRQGVSQLQADFTGVNLTPLALFADYSQLPMDGQLQGNIQATWPGWAVDRLSAEFHTNLTGQLRLASAKTLPGTPVTNQTVASSTIPSLMLDSAMATTMPTVANNLPPFINGEFHGKWDAATRQLALTQAELQLPGSILTATGSLTKQSFDLQVRFQTDDFAQTERLARQLGLLNALPAKLPTTLQGQVAFVGSLQGSFTDPTLAGKIIAEHLITADAELGQITGQVSYQAGNLVLTDTVLQQADGGRLELDLDPRSRATAKNVVLLRFRGFTITPAMLQTCRKLAEQFDATYSAYLLMLIKDFAGKINGEIDLQNLPAPDFVWQQLQKGEYRPLLQLTDLTGKIDLTIENQQLNGNFRRLAVKFAVKEKLLRLNQLQLDLIAGSLQGSAVFNPQDQTYQLNIASERLNLADIVTAPERRRIAPVVALNVTGQGSIDHPVVDARLTSARFPVLAQEMQNLVLTLHAAESYADFRAEGLVQQESYNVAGRIKLTDDFPLEAEIGLVNRNLLPLLQLFVSLPPRLEMITTGTLRIRGPLATDEGLSLNRIRVTTDLSKLAVGVKNTDQDTANYVVTNTEPVVVVASLGRLVFRSFNIQGEGTSFSVKGNYVSNRNSTLDLRGQINLRLLNTFSSSLFVDGTANISASVVDASGTPRLTGSAEIRNLAARYIDVPLALQDGNGRILFTANRALIENFTARSVTGGEVRASGGILLENALPDKFRLDLKVNGLRLNYPTQVRSLLDGDLALQGSKDVQVLSGRVKIRRAEYSERTDIATLIAAGNKLNLVTTDLRFGSNVNLDISVDAQDALLIRNNLADVVGTANLKLTGPLTDPLISGRASINRGTVTLRSERYNVLRGLVDLPESRTGQARFDFEADTDLNGFRVIINVVGTLSRFNTTLRSEPSLPQDDIIALITTGQLPAPGVTPQSLESQSRVGAALSLLTDTLSEKVEQRTGRLFGLNRFQIDPLLAARRGSDPTARITLGRRINKDLSLTYSANVTTGQEQIIVIEYQVNRNVSFIGTREQDGSYGFDIRFRKRF